MRLVFKICLILLFTHVCKTPYAQITVFPQGSVDRILQVHDSISPFTEVSITHGTNIGQGLKTRLYAAGEAELHNRLGDLILKSGATGPGVQMVLEEFGNIGIGYPRFSATNALHIKDVDPLRLDGLTNNLTFDTVLVVSPTGVLHKRAQNTFPASYWIKSGNYVYNLSDSIGIGTTSPSERLYVRDAAKIGSSSGDSRLKLESVFVESEFGQYRVGTSELLLNGILPASGLTFLNAKEGASDVVTSQGLLLNVEAARPMIFAVNNKEAMRIDSNAWLSIGTDKPIEPLHVDSSMYVGELIRLGRSSIKVGKYKEVSPTLNDVHIYAPDYIQFASAIKTQMVDPRGTPKPWATFDNFLHRLGIDTISPEYRLHVNGNASIEDSLFVPKIRFGPENKNIISSDASGLIIENNHTFSDSRSDIVISNSSGQIMTMEKDQINFSFGSQNYLKFDGKNERLAINPFTTNPRETLDVGGSAIVDDTIIISSYDKFISGQAGNLEIASDEPINITADLSNVTISDGTIPYAIFEGTTRNFGLLNSGPVRKKLEVGGSGLFQDSIFIKTLDNAISSTSSDQLKIESGKDIVIAAAANQDVIFQKGSGSTFAIFDGSTERVGIGTSSPQETLDVNGTVETDKIKITDGAIPGRILISDGDGLGSWGTVPPDGDWVVAGTNMQAGVPGNIQVGVGIAQNSKLSVNGSIAKSILVTGLPTYNIANTDYTVVLTNPGGVMATLPAANTCPGRIYQIKFLSPGGSVQSVSITDLIDNTAGAFAVPGPVGGIATTITIQSDGGSGWWIIN
jgi:hypothetical protein